MGATAEGLRRRTFDLAVRTVAFVRALPRGAVEFRLGAQLIDSSTSVAAHYRAACRAQSTRDFIAKIRKLEEEADESAMWLQLLGATGLPEALAQEAAAIEREFGEITAIAVASARTARSRLERETTARQRARSSARSNPVIP